jgi:chemotaxis protein MotB
MKSIWIRTAVVLAGLTLLPSCTAKYQQMLQEKDNKIRDLYTQVAELTATNQDLDSRERGARERVQTLEERLAARVENGPSDLDKLRSELPGVDVRVSGNRLTLGINNTVTFGSGSSSLKTTAGSVLKNVARVLQRDFPGRRIIIEGHTDVDPIRKTKNKFRNNRHLSLERADAVANYLIGRCGVRDSNVVVAGYGQFQPLTRASGKPAKARNRRVEIVVAESL